MDTVELSVNAYAGDLPFLEQTYRHLIRQTSAAPLSRRRIVVDRRPPTGRFATNHSSADLDAVLSRLLADGVVDDVDDVDWSTDEVERVAAKYFGRADAPSIAHGESALHQYLWAIDTSNSPLVLHFDSDMLVHDPMHGAWIAESIDILRNNANVAITSPQPGPPRASSLGQWLRGRPDGDSGVRWVPAGGVSTRIFLMDRERLEGALPLENGSTGEALESMLALGLSKAGLERWDRNDHNTWAIHPRRHNENHIRHLAGLIELVERGRYPYLRTGYNWDIRTEGRHFIPWRVLLARERLRSYR